MNEDLEKGFDLKAVYVFIVLLVVVGLAFFISRTGENSPDEDLPEETPAPPEIKTINDLASRKAAFSSEDLLRIIEKDYPIQTNLPISSFGDDIDESGKVFINFFSYFTEDSEDTTSNLWRLYAEDNNFTETERENYDLFFESEDDFDIGIWFEVDPAVSKLRVSVEFL